MTLPFKQQQLPGRGVDNVVKRERQLPHRGQEREMLDYICFYLFPVPGSHAHFNTGRTVTHRQHHPGVWVRQMMSIRSTPCPFQEGPPASLCSAKHPAQPQGSTAQGSEQQSLPHQHAMDCHSFCTGMRQGIHSLQ